MGDDVFLRRRRQFAVGSPCEGVFKGPVSESAQNQSIPMVRRRGVLRADTRDGFLISCKARESGRRFSTSRRRGSRSREGKRGRTCLGERGVQV